MQAGAGNYFGLVRITSARSPTGIAQGRGIHQGVMNIGVGLTRSTIAPWLSHLFSVEGASKLRPIGSEASVAQTG